MLYQRRLVFTDRDLVPKLARGFYVDAPFPEYGR